MSERTSRYKEIVVRVIPPPTETSRSSSEEIREIRGYNALIYTNLTIPGLTSGELPSNQPREEGGLPLVACEKIDLHWQAYQEYLARFDLGEKEAGHMRDRLVEAMTEGLRVLFTKFPWTQSPVRLWWSVEAPELEDLPWDLLSNAGHGPAETEFSFVRGMPPKVPPPLVPVDGPLRLGVIGRPGFLADSLLQALAPGSIPGLEITHLPLPPFKAMQTAAREGFELLHVVADGEVLLSYEGVLYFHGEREPRLSSGELSSCLHGSRVTVLCLSSSVDTNPDLVEIGGYSVPSAYRAFAQIASEDLPLPNIVAPLGPIDPVRLGAFWQRFYTHLAETYRIEQAMLQGRQNEPLPLALFLRHSQGVLFRRRRPVRSLSPEEAPVQLEVELQISRSLIGQLHTLAARYGELPDSVNEFLHNHDLRNSQLDEELESWRRPEDDDL